MQPIQAKYNTWKDRGGNIGVQCEDCSTVFWTTKEPNGKVARDPNNLSLGEKECENCKLIKEMGIIKAENEAHKNHVKEEDCNHRPSQP